ncbi:MAG: glycosyltransferase family 4 protein [Desulfurococcaceae archaeon]
MKFLSVMYQTSNSKGQELLAQRMVKWARRLGHEAWLVTSAFHDGEAVISERRLAASERGYEIFEKDPAIGLPTIRVGSSKTVWPPRRIMFRDFVNVLRRLDDELGVDFLLTHSTLWNGPEDAAKWVLWKRLMKTMGEPLRETIYGHMSHYQPPDPLRYSLAERTFRMAWNLSALPSIFKAAHMVLCLTGIEAEDMVSLGARPDQIHLFPGGLDDDLARLVDAAKPDDFRERYGIPGDKLIVSYLGTVEYRKNPLAVVRIARRLRHLKDVIFVVAGRPGDQWNDVVREARDLNNVVVTGELDEALKASLIKASYLNVIMSRAEAFGLTQLEFMYAGVPVVTSAVYGQRWLVRNGVDGVHVNGPDDVEGAARTIEGLVRDPEKRDELGRNASERARSMLFSELMKGLLEAAEKFAGRG